jgi:hypothetical protein
MCRRSSVTPDIAEQVRTSCSSLFVGQWLACVTIFLVPTLSFVQSANQTGEAATLPAQRVSLTGTMRLRQALAALNEQLQGNHLADLRPMFGQPADDLQRNFDLRDVTFWQAADRIAQLTGLRLIILPPQKERGMLVGLVTPTDSPGRNPIPVVYDGPFRIAIPEIQAIRNFEEPHLSRLELVLEFACEPRYIPIWLQWPRDAVRYRETGGQQKIVEQAGHGTIRWLGEGALRWRIRLPLPERTQTRLPGFTVHGTALVAPKRLTAQISSFAPAKPTQIEDVQISVQEADFSSTHNRWRFRLRLTYPRSDGRRGFDLESYHTWIMESAQVRLVHSTRNTSLAPIRPPAIAVENASTFSLEAIFPAPAKVAPADSRDWTLQVSCLATPVYVPVRAEFSDLPLP